MNAETPAFDLADHTVHLPLVQADPRPPYHADRDRPGRANHDSDLHGCGY